MPKTIHTRDKKKGVDAAETRSRRKDEYNLAYNLQWKILIANFFDDKGE